MVGIAAILLGTAAALAMVVWALDWRAAQPSAQAESISYPRPGCAKCGVVASLRAIRDSGEKGRKHEVTVRMQDGSNHVFVAATTANWRTGSRLIVIEGVEPSAD